jgi:hypothetical protein
MANYDDGVTLPPIIQQWLDTYNNNDLEQHIALYTDSASILIPAPGGNHIDLNPDHNKAVFRHMEQALDAAAPNRKVRFDWVSVAGNEVSVEATLMLTPGDPQGDQSLALHFTLSADGTSIVRDRTYIDSSVTAGLAADPAR